MATKGNSIKKLQNLNGSKDGVRGSCNSLYERLYNNPPKALEPVQHLSNHASNIIDSTKLENVQTSMNTLMNNGKTFSSCIEKASQKDFLEKFGDQFRTFEKTITDLNYNDKKSYKFRVVPKRWGSYEMNDCFVNKTDLPENFNIEHNYALNYYLHDGHNCKGTKAYMINVKLSNVETREIYGKYKYPCIEMNEVLMAQLQLPKFSIVSLKVKNTVLNFYEKLELIVISNSSTFGKTEILEDFKKKLCSSLIPLLVNQGQILKLCGNNVFVAARIHPESFGHCLCDAEILRENKVYISEQNNVASGMETSLEIGREIFQSSIDHQCILHLDEHEHIISDCVTNIISKNCLTGKNSVKRFNNYIITGNIYRNNDCFQVKSSFNVYP